MELPSVGALPIKTTIPKFEQTPKATAPTEVTFAGMVTLVSAVQPRNALLPMLVTLEGIVTPVSAVH